MGREILFKAKRIDNGEWVEGSLLLTESKAYIVVDAETMSMDNECTDLYATEWYEVDKETICQYTGLNDKNGNKIWENDFIQYTDDVGRIKNDLIVWKTPFSSFARKSKCNYGLEFQYLWISELQAKESEVICNIFDNPELLGGDE